MHISFQKYTLALYLSTMFGFLFKKSKNASEKEPKGQNRRLSKDLHSICIDTTVSSPSDPPTFQHSLNSVSLSTDSLYPSASDSGKESGDSLDQSSTTSLANHVNSGQLIDQKPNILPEDDTIVFIDELPLELGNRNSFFETRLDNDGCADSKRQLTDAERKAMVQLEEIRSKLISKETELSLLQADINMLAVDRDNKVQEIGALTVQLDMLRYENESSLKSIHKFEVQLEDFSTKNAQLSEELLQKAEQLRCLEQDSSKSDDVSGELNFKMKQLEGKISELETERDKLIKDRDAFEKEKHNQIRGIKGALDDALDAKIKLQIKFEKELKDLQESNSSLLDDFEWKLRQIEATCKKKLQEKDKQIEEKVKEAKEQSCVNLTAEKEALDSERKALTEQLRQVAHMKAYEVELTQLRGVTQEQQKSIRAAARQLDQLKCNEKTMQDETRSLKSLLEKEKTHCQVITNSAQRRLDQHEETLKSRLERQTKEINSKWEDKLKEECSKLKQHFSQLEAEEKKLAVESMKLQKEQELSTAKQSWERARKDLVQEISRLKDQITEKESSFNREIAKATTIIDRDNWELRRTVEKISNASMEEIDSLKESHSKEMELLQTRHDNTLVQLEKLKKKVEEYEKTSRSTDSVETEKDSGFAAGESSQSLVDHTNIDGSECSSEEEESEEESEEEVSEEEVEKTKNVGSQKVVDSASTIENPNNSILELREEVATLQDSIETLTLSLVQNAEGHADLNNLDISDAKDTPALLPDDGEACESLISETENSFYTGSESPHVSSEAEESDLQPFLLIGVIPLLSYMFFQSILVVFWTYFVLIAFRLSRPEANTKKE